MLTIRKIGGTVGAVQYYAEYAQENGESAGKFVDRSAALGVDGKTVTAETMERLLYGYAPDGATALCKNPGDGHTPGWDLTFSPPKSVSIAWSNADDALRAEVEQAHERAVKASLGFIEREAGFVRTGRGGAQLERADLVFSLFQHSSNRAEEPQLHTHAILYNVARTHKDKVWRTLLPRPVYRAYMAAGALYKAELAHGMQRLGFKTERTKDSFELVGVPQSVCEAQSSRSKELEELLRQKGLTRAQATARAKEILTLESRQTKDRITRDFERWQKENSTQGFGPTEQARLLEGGKDQTSSTSAHEQKERAGAALKELTRQNSTFNVYALYRAVAETAIGAQSADDIERTVDTARKSREVLQVGQNSHGEERFSTREMYRIEREVMQTVKQRRGEGLHRVPAQSVEDAIVRRPTITDEQVRGLRHIVLGKDGVTFVEGDAGTGKSFLMGAVRDVYEQSGYQMVGLAFTNKAAKGLEVGSGIKSRSVDSFLLAYRANPDALPKKAVIVLDEAAMLDSRKMHELIGVAAERGAKLVAIGDEKQIQPITAGQAFGTLGRAFGSERLSEIIRQKEVWERAAIQGLAEGRTDASLRAFDEKGALRLVESRGDARAAIITEWEKAALGGVDKAPLIVVSTNAEVTTLNLMARERLVAAGRVAAGVEIKTAHGAHPFAPGDQIIFTGNFKKKGILNSTLARVEKVNPRTKALTIRTETGERVKFSPKTMNHFRHGYAITAHKSQGSTVDRVLVMVDSAYMDREKLYVAMSRGRARSTLFADKATVGGLSYEDREKIKALPSEEREAAERDVFRKNLVRIVGASHRKDTTHDYDRARSAFARGLELGRSSGRALEELRAGLARQFERLADGLKSLGRAPERESEHITPEPTREPVREAERERDDGIER